MAAHKYPHQLISKPSRTAPNYAKFEKGDVVPSRDRASPTISVRTTLPATL